MAKKNFIRPPFNILEEAKTDKEFYVNIDGVLPKAVGMFNKFLPINVPLIDINDLPVGISPLGTLVFDNIRFLPGRYTTPENTAGKPYKGLIIDTVVFEARQAKNIIKTYVQGRDKSVKEYINAGDIDITISGFIVNDVFKNFYPYRDVQTFIEIMKVPKSLTVQSKFLGMLDVKYITITNWRFAQTPGQRNMQAFTINCVDDISSERNDINTKVVSK